MAVRFPVGVHIPLQQLEQFELTRRKCDVVMCPNANRFHDLAAVTHLRQHNHLQIRPQLEKPLQRLETLARAIAQLQKDEVGQGIAVNSRHCRRAERNGFRVIRIPCEKRINRMQGGGLVAYDEYVWSSHIADLQGWLSVLVRTASICSSGIGVPSPRVAKK